MAAVKTKSALKLDVKVEYSWRPGFPGVNKVDAKVAGREFERIYKRHGELNPHTIVDEARPESSPLHDVFEWDDSTAADEYRAVQARKLIQSLQISVETPKGPREIRAIVHVAHDADDEERESGYLPVNKVFGNTQLRRAHLAQALADLARWQARYNMFEELASVYEAIEKAKSSLA